MKRERGFGWIEVVITLAAVAAVISAAWGAVAWHAGVHFKRGELARQALWDTANREAEDLKRRQGAAVGRALMVADNARQDAENKASEAQANYEEAKREARRNKVALGGCSSEVATLGGAAAAAGVRLTWEFVREFDGAWTGLGGEPVFQAPAGSAGAEQPGAFAPYRLEDVVDVAGANALRCSRDRRELDTLINKIRAAGAAWESVNSQEKQP